MLCIRFILYITNALLFQWCVCYYTTGHANKNNPLQRIRCLWNCKFFCQIHHVYRGEFRPYIQQISLQYLIAFKNYNYLNLNAHFSKWTSTTIKKCRSFIGKNEWPMRRQISNNWIIVWARCWDTIRNTRQNRPTLPSWRLPCYWYGMICHRSSLIRQSHHFKRARLRSCVAATGGHFEHSV